MTTPQQPGTLDIGGGGDGTSFQFEPVGAVVSGLITGMTEQPQTDVKTKEPKTFKDGSPMTMYVVTLQTDLRNSAGLAEPVATDTGLRSVYLKGSKKPEEQTSLGAVLGAVKTATGGTALAIGGKLTLQYIGDGPRTQAGFNPPKKYAAAYEPPALNLAPGIPAPSMLQAMTSLPAAPAPVVPQPVAPQPIAPQAVAPAVATDPVAQLRAAGVPDEQIRAMGFQVPDAAPVAASVDVIALHPQGAALRAAGLGDDQIRAALGIPA